MKAKLRLLNYLEKKEIINTNDFYCISINRGGISLQGHLTESNAKKYQDVFGDGVWVSKQNWLSIKTKNIEITLTTV